MMSARTELQLLIQRLMAERDTPSYASLARISAVERRLNTERALRAFDFTLHHRIRQHVLNSATTAEDGTRAAAR